MMILLSVVDCQKSDFVLRLYGEFLRPYDCIAIFLEVSASLCLLFSMISDGFYLHSHSGSVSYT